MTYIITVVQKTDSSVTYGPFDGPMIVLCRSNERVQADFPNLTSDTRSLLPTPTVHTSCPLSNEGAA